jgi:dienelactone hydrolase
MGEAYRYGDGEFEAAGVLERPAQPNGRAVLIAHEVNGVGDNVRRRARMLAELGYLALAIDVYGGGRTFDGDAAVEQMNALRAEPDQLRRRARAGLDALAGLDLARSGAPLAAAISFHGLLTTERPAGPGGIAAKILACTGARDPLVPLDDVTAFQREMDAAAADWQLIVYGRALHSFTNRNVIGGTDPRLAYDPSADRQSWAAALLFLDEALGGG